MGSSSLSEDYRLCLERELRRGRAGVCGDPSLRAVLWHILVEDFDLHGALQDDALALLTDGLWGRADLAPALRSLARAFELLELAAVHLYLLPWRKEFTTIKASSGADRSQGLSPACWGWGAGPRGSGVPGVFRILRPRQTQNTEGLWARRGLPRWPWEEHGWKAAGLGAHLTHQVGITALSDLRAQLPWKP